MLPDTTTSTLYRSPHEPCDAPPEMTTTLRRQRRWQRRRARVQAPSPAPSPFWADPTSASRRCSTASWARSWPSSRPSRRRRATGSPASTTASAARSSSSTRPASTARKKELNRFMVERGAGRDPGHRRGAAGDRLDVACSRRRPGRAGGREILRALAEARPPGRARHQQGRHGEGQVGAAAACSSAGHERPLRAHRPDLRPQGDERRPPGQRAVGAAARRAAALRARHADRSQREIPGRRADPRAAVPRACARRSPTRSPS